MTGIYILYSIGCNFQDKWVLETYQGSLLELQTELGKVKFALKDLKTDLNVHKKITMEKAQNFFNESDKVNKRMNDIMETSFKSSKVFKYIKNDYRLFRNQIENLREELGAGLLKKMLKKKWIIQNNFLNSKGI